MPNAMLTWQQGLALTLALGAVALACALLRGSVGARAASPPSRARRR